MEPKKIEEQLNDVKSLGNLNGQFKLFWKEDGKCFGTSWSMSISAITSEDVYEKDGDKEEVKAFLEGRLLGRDYNCMVVAQPKYALKCIKDKCEIPVSLDDMAQIIGGKAELVSYDSKDIRQALSKSAGTLIEDPELAITIGRDMYEAYGAMKILEKSAEVFHKGKFIGGVRVLPSTLVFYQRNKYLKKYSEARRDKASQRESMKEPGNASEERLRKQLVDCGRELLKEDLVQGTWGNLSVRIDDEYMLVTPSGLPYDKLNPEDMVKVRIYDLEYDEAEGTPTSEMMLHANIYMRREDVAAVVHTHSNKASIFAACKMPVEIVCDDGREEIIRCTHYANAGGSKLADYAVEELKGRSGVLLANHGMVSVGKDLPAAMESGRVIEKAANSIIESKRDDTDMEVSFL